MTTALGIRIFKWTFSGIALFIGLNVVLFMYRIQVKENHLIGRPFIEGATRKIFEKRFQWDSDISDYRIGVGTFSKDNSPCKAALYPFERTTEKNTREVLLVAHLADFEYYRPDDIKIVKEDLEKPTGEMVGSYPTIGVTRKIIFPLLVFNFRAFPKGERLQVYGIDTSYCRDTVLGEWAVKIIEGDFSEIGFEVVPNDGFIKNIPQAIGFAGFRKHGALLFLRDKENRTIMMIQFVESVKGEEYKPYLDSLLEKLPALSIKKL